jgi:hypothetical protein
MAAITTSGSPQPYVEIIFQPNEQIRPDATQIDGAFWVIPHGFAEGLSTSDISFKALLIDCSGSFAKQNKLEDAILGTKQALLQSVSPNDYFGIYSFADKPGFNADNPPRRLWPTHGRGKPQKGTPANIQEAISALPKLVASGDTFLSYGLEAVLEDFLSLPDCDEGTVALKTDGENSDYDYRRLNAALGKIQACRPLGKILKVQPIGIGREISQAQLNMISEACLGDPVQHIKPNTGPEVWAEVTSKIFDGLSRKKLRSVKIRFVDMPSTVKLLNFSQQRPTVLNLTGEAKVGSDEHSLTIETGGWEGDLKRLYSFSLGVKRPSTSDSLLAGCLEISYKVGRREVVLDRVPIKVRWTNIASLSARIPAELAEARGITGSVEAISLGIAALEAGQKAQAQIHLQRAYDLAREANDQSFIRDFGDFVEINHQTHVVTVRSLTREDSNRLDSASKTRKAD